MAIARDLVVCLLAGGLLLAAASGQAAASCPPGEIAAPASFTTEIRPALALDTNPDAGIVEVDLTARPAVWDFGIGNTTPVWTYNGTIPGPTIEAKVGDVLIVNFCNDLPEETTIHWHGVETPANMDGSNLAQLAVPAGGLFRYSFVLNKAGTFWYHPHIRTNVQVEKGLYGVLVVRDPAEDLALGLPEREHIFVLDDLSLDAEGQIEEAFVGTREEVALEQLNGREGETQLLNGAYWPFLSMERRVPHRIRILNAANARFVRMTILDHQWWRIGGDQGLLEAPILVEPSADAIPTLCSFAAGGPSALAPEPRHPSDGDPTTGLLLTPGERADMIVFLEDLDPATRNETDCFPFEWHDTQRGRHSVEFNPDGTVSLAHDVPDGTNFVRDYAFIELYGSSTATEYAPPATLRTLTPIDAAGAPTLPLVMGHTIPDWNTGETTFFVQAMGKPFAALTPFDVHSVFLGGTYVWEVRNLTGGHHNFHTHGWGFQHLETEFVDLDFPGDPTRNYVEPAAQLENKDTILIKRRPGTVRGRSWSLTRLAVTFDAAGRGDPVASSGVPTEDRSGGWLAHCHILEHSARGMMTYFQIRDIFSDGFESGDVSAWSATLP